MDAEEDAIEQDRTADKEGAEAPHQEPREAHLGSQEPRLQDSIPGPHSQAQSHSRQESQVGPYFYYFHFIFFICNMMKKNNPITTLITLIFTKSYCITKYNNTYLMYS